MRHSDYTGYLQCENKALKRKVAKFESGEMYLELRRMYQKLLDEKDRRYQKLKKECDELRRSERRAWQWCEQVVEDAEKEYQKKHLEDLRTIEKERKRRYAAEAARDEAQATATEANHKYYEAATELEKEKGKNIKLRAQLNHDYENSSIPSSKSIKRKKITNSRERTGRKPGAQPGHAHHPRKKQIPTQIINLAPPSEITEDPDFRPTGKTIVKQLIGVHMVMDVTEYHAEVFRNAKTGELRHAAFPDGVVNDVNYDGTVKALLFYLNVECAVSIDKCCRFLNDLTGGKLQLSKGMTNKLSSEFADKSKSELRKMFSDMLRVPVVHTDCTNARCNGKSSYVYVCADTAGNALYFAREKKGHEGVKGTVVEDYQGILVHDHDKSFYSYGSAHQECLAHVLRYTKDSCQNEPGRQWNREMLDFLRQIMHYRNEHDREAALDAEAVSEFEKRYDEILQKAADEYADEPASDYYRDGYNLYKRLRDKENYLLFLHDMRVPATNNASERYLRDYKRKQLQAISFRSNQSIEDLCQSKSMLLKIRNSGDNVYDRIAQVFNSKREPDPVETP